MRAIAFRVARATRADRGDRLACVPLADRGDRLARATRMPPATRADRGDRLARSTRAPRAVHAAQANHAINVQFSGSRWHFPRSVFSQPKNCTLIGVVDLFGAAGFANRTE